MAVTVSAHVVTVGGAPLGDGADSDGLAVSMSLAALGVPVVSRVFVDDDEAALEHALAPDGALTVILTGPGGSGGDIVRRALARVAGARLVLNERMLGALEALHRQHDRPLPRWAERLALLPQGATLWLTASREPAWMFDSGRSAFVVLPRGSGIEARLNEHLVPFVRQRFVGRGVVLGRTLRTAGVSASEVEERLTDWLGKEGDVSVTTLPTEGDVWVRLRARGATPEAAAKSLEVAEAGIVAALGEDYYGRDQESLEQVVGRLLIERRLSLAVAESCTGGLLSHRLTNIPGSSTYFERSVVVYSNRAKQELLRVPESILRVHGAVSGPCAEAMARGICETARVPCGLSITGIAGPEGGTPEKPIGTVFIGLGFRGDVVAKRFRFAGDRATIKWQSAHMALDMLRRRLTPHDERTDQGGIG